MERFEDFLAAEVIGATGIAVEDVADLHESEFSEQESARESISTDDPVRVYPVSYTHLLELISMPSALPVAMRTSR